MKNFKIVMILVAAVALFCSCGNNATEPVAAFSDANGQTETTFDLANPSFDVNIACAISDEYGIKTLNVTKTVFDANEEVLGDVSTYTFDEPYADAKDYVFSIVETLAKADVENAAKVVYKAVIVNNKDKEATATYTVNVVAPSFTEANFTWVRQGGSGTGLAEYGLQWTSNLKVIQAVIKPVEGAKLYILQASDYAATSVDAITFPAEATQYKSVSCEANGTYNDVIATVYNNKTYVINVTKGEVVSETAGTKITITGTVKTFEATPAAAK